MAADATDQTTAAKTESAGQSMGRGAGKETVTVYAGNIVQIGRRSDGSRNVVFRSASSTFDTQWPKWAYQIAMAAYLYDKQIQVIADGQPDGDKLRSVNLILPVHPQHQGPQPAHYRPLTSENSTAALILAHRVRRWLPGTGGSPWPCSPRPSSPSPPPTGAGAIIAAPGPAITDGKQPPDNEDHDLQLEYQALPIGNT